MPTCIHIGIMTRCSLSPGGTLSSENGSISVFLLCDSPEACSHAAQVFRSHFSGVDRAHGLIHRFRRLAQIQRGGATSLRLAEICGNLWNSVQSVDKACGIGLGIPSWLRLCSARHSVARIPVQFSRHDADLKWESSKRPTAKKSAPRII